MAFPWLGRSDTVADSPIAFGHLVTFQGTVQCSGGRAAYGKEENPGGGTVNAVDGVDTLTDLIPQDFHGDQIVILWLIGRMN
jgi:hypothetical protein